MVDGMIGYYATENELSLLDDIVEIGFGELFNLEYVEQPAIKTVQVTEKAKNFLAALRIIKRASRLVIHDSEPYTLEFRTTTGNGRRCLIKMKF